MFHGKQRTNYQLFTLKTELFKQYWTVIKISFRRIYVSFTASGNFAVIAYALFSNTNALNLLWRNIFKKEEISGQVYSLEHVNQTNPTMLIVVYHNSRLIRWIQQNVQKIHRLDQGLDLFTCFDVSHSNLFTRKFSVFVQDCKWVLIHAWVILSNPTNSSNKMTISSFWKKTIIIPEVPTISHKSLLLQRKESKTSDSWFIQQ